MSKGLEALDYIRFYTDEVDSIGCLIYYEQFNIIEKELKALEIIKEKRVDCKSLVECEHIDEYNSLWFDIPLDQEEFNLLKEVLEE